MAKKTITILDKLNGIISNAKNGKKAYRESIQEALILFVNNYNTELTYNTTPFKEIVLTVGKDIKDLRNWLFEYTNLTKVYSDLLHFETSEYELGKDGKKLYKLKFKETFNGQLWYSIESDKRAVKELTNDTFANSLKALYKKYTNSFLEYDDKTDKLLKAIKTTYNLD